MLLKFVTAFSDNVNSGNPAAVYLIDRFLKDEVMQELSAKINLSETAFVKKLSLNNYHIRWFTPTSEAPMCGHATLASTHVLYENMLVRKNAKIKFFNNRKSFIVFQESDWICMNFPSFKLKAKALDKTLSSILQGYTISYIGISQNILFVELLHSHEVQTFIPKLDLIASLPYRALLITSKDDQYDFISRYFAPSVGIPEDPVCGSAHCRLIPYWSQKLKKDSMIAYQASERGGVIKCENLKNGVIISGQAVTLKKHKNLITMR